MLIHRSQNRYGRLALNLPDCSRKNHRKFRPEPGSGHVHRRNRSARVPQTTPPTCVYLALSMAKLHIPVTLPDHVKCNEVGENKALEKSGNTGVANNSRVGSGWTLFGNSRRAPCQRPYGYGLWTPKWAVATALVALPPEPTAGSCRDSAWVDSGVMECQGFRSFRHSTA